MRRLLLGGALTWLVAVTPAAAVEWIFAPAGTYGPNSMNMAAVEANSGMLGVACYRDHVIAIHMHAVNMMPLIGSDVRMDFGIDGLKGEQLSFPAAIDPWMGSAMARSEIGAAGAESLAAGSRMVRLWLVANGKFQRIADFPLSGAKIAISAALEACAAQDEPVGR